MTDVAAPGLAAAGMVSFSADIPADVATSGRMCAKNDNGGRTAVRGG